jgi:hypothetical protein
MFDSGLHLLVLNQPAPVGLCNAAAHAGAELGIFFRSDVTRRQPSKAWDDVLPFTTLPPPISN